MDNQTVDRCIRAEGKYRDVGVYVVVVVADECPVEVQVSLAFGLFESITNKRQAETYAATLVDLSNEWLSAGASVSGLIKFLKRPPCDMSGIIGNALCAALEG